MPLILVIESNIKLRDMIATKLMEHDYDVMRVSRTSQASDLLNNITVNLILVDRTLPERDAIEWIAELRQNGYRGKLFLMIPQNFPKMTAEDYTYLIEKLKIDEILDKSIPMKELVEKVKLALKSPQQGKKTWHLHRNTLRRLAHTQQELLHFQHHQNQVSTQPKEELFKKKETLEYHRPQEPSLNVEELFSDLPFLEDPEEDPSEDTPPISFRSTSPITQELPESQTFFKGTFSDPIDPDVSRPVIDKLNKGLERLKKNYQVKLNKQLQELTQLIEESSQTLKLATLKKAHQTAHKIHGTAGSFGFMEVSHLVGEAEELLFKIEMSPPMAVPNDWNKLKELLQKASHKLGALEEKTTSPSSSTSTPEEPSFLTDSPAQGLLRLLTFSQKEHHPLIERLETSDINHQIRVNKAHSPNAILDFLNHRPADLIFLELEKELIDALQTTPTGTIPKIKNLKNSVMELAQNIREKHATPIVLFAEEIPITVRSIATHLPNVFFLSSSISDEELKKLLLRYTHQPTKMTLKVLILDDDEFFAERLSLVLKKAGLQANFLTKPDNLLKYLDKFKPDVLLLDLKMPKFNGFELIKMLRATPEQQDLIIFILTVDLTDQNRINAFEIGADDFINKPINNDELITRIKSRFARRAHFAPSNSSNTLTR